MIVIDSLTKRYGSHKVLNRVSFTAKDGRVTGLVGPKAAGKSTTLRIALGLVRPDVGRALFDGHPFVRLTSPMRPVGAVLNPRKTHSACKVKDHLLALAAVNSIDHRRVDQVLEMVGLQSIADRPMGSLSLGMSQRLALATALLGDPHNLALDGPLDGLDSEGSEWVRGIWRSLASQGRAVLLSSRKINEMAQIADDLVIIAKGRILERTTVARFIGEHSRDSIYAVTPQPDQLKAALATAAGISITRLPPDKNCPPDAARFRIQGAPLASTASILAQEGVVLYEFQQEEVSLEQAYKSVIHGRRDVRP
ncbi:ATP-binding cassette domain-containing protein [Bifidobacterium sp. wkB344]|uniref:ATP-binding cassette domain-containing protein n=1 Tax=Bifidobacterium sp. wkB344 TaxID=2025113 RepID=UPI000EF9E64A|nr:ATP-binding cassette domain-containing protein [Bifidobacterium sp. wkB344]RMA44681.1 multidrug ABC transporter ATP-binding protein [Bifidobacterium sp. wkB344]